MDQHAITKYLEQLAVIKQRGQIFQKFSKGAIDDIDEEAAVEIATLQLNYLRQSRRLIAGAPQRGCL